MPVIQPAIFVQGGDDMPMPMTALYVFGRTGYDQGFATIPSSWTHTQGSSMGNCVSDPYFGWAIDSSTPANATVWIGGNATPEYTSTGTGYIHTYNIKSADPISTSWTTSDTRPAYPTGTWSGYFQIAGRYSGTQARTGYRGCFGGSIVKGTMTVTVSGSTCSVTFTPDEDCTIQVVGGNNTYKLFIWPIIATKQ